MGKIDTSNIVMGIAWYQQDQWELLKKVSIDSDIIEDTYKDWQKNAKKLIKDMKRSGIDPIRVNLDVNKLIKWCSDKKKPLNSASRSEYVTDLLRDKNR